MVRVLGVDPGLSRCGVGVVEPQRGRNGVVAVRAGVIRTDAGEPTGQRLVVIHAALSSLIAELDPAELAVERVFVNANLHTAVGVGQAAGVVLLCAAQAGLPVTEYTPTQVKVRVTGSGAADKQQVGYMVAAQLGLDGPPTPVDASDALAVALCHLQAAGAAVGAGGDGSARLPARVQQALDAAGPGAQVVQRGRP